MSLVDAPIEILQAILTLCATSDYLQLIRTCRKLHTVGTSHWVVSHHLHQLPGFGLTSPEEIDSHSAVALYKELKRRSTFCLLGANIHSESILYLLQDAATIDISASTIFQPNRVRHESDMPSAAIVPKNGDCVRLYRADLDSNPPTFSLHGILKFPYEHPGKVEILHVFYYHSDNHIIYVLQRYHPLNMESLCQAQNPMNAEDEEIQAFSSPGIHLVRYDWHRIRRSCWTATSISRFPGWESGYFPLAMEAVDRDVVAICWTRPESDKHGCLYLHRPHDLIIETDKCKYMKYLSCEISTKGRNRFFPDFQAKGLESPNSSYKPGRRISRMYFEPEISRLFYSSASSPIHFAYQELRPNSRFDRIEVKYFIKRFSFARSYHRQVDLCFSRISMPFYSIHRADIQTMGAQPRCGWSCLAVGSRYGGKAEHGRAAYLLRSDFCCPNNSGIIHHSRRIATHTEWIIAAKLLGYDKIDRSPGKSICYSRLGTRIAVSCQKRVYIWPLEPNEVLMMNMNGYYPSSMQCRVDEKDGLPSYNVARNRGGDDEFTVALEPIILELKDNCHSMRFLDGENELMMLTDAGVMIWRLDVYGTGERLSVIV